VYTIFCQKAKVTGGSRYNHGAFTMI